MRDYLRLLRVGLVALRVVLGVPYALVAEIGVVAMKPLQRHELTVIPRTQGRHAKGVVLRKLALNEAGCAKQVVALTAL